MKAKKLKKLALNKKTIVNLGNGQLGRINGGDFPKTSYLPCAYSDCPDQCITLKFTNCETCATVCTCVSDCLTQCGGFPC